jgi:hypothetical protein
VQVLGCRSAQTLYENFNIDKVGENIMVPSTIFSPAAAVN